MKKVMILIAALAVVVASTVAMAAEADQLATQAQPAAQQAQTWPSFALNVTGLDMTSDTWIAAQSALIQVQGVKNASIDAEAKQAWVWYDAAATSPEQIAESFTKAQAQFQASVAQSQPATVN